MALKAARYFLHGAVWVLLYFLPYLLSFRGVPSLRTVFFDSGDVVHLISFLLLIAYSYANYFAFVPKWYLRKRYWLYGLVLVASLTVVVKLPQTVDPVFGDKPPGMQGGPQHLDEGPPDFEKPLLGLTHHPGPPGKDHPILFGMNYVIVLFLASTFIGISVQQRLAFFRMEKEKLAAELLF